MGKTCKLSGMHYDTTTIPRNILYVTKLVNFTHPYKHTLITDSRKGFVLTRVWDEYTVQEQKNLVVEYSPKYIYKSMTSYPDEDNRNSSDLNYKKDA